MESVPQYPGAVNEFGTFGTFGTSGDALALTFVYQVWAALLPILARHRCRRMTGQTFVNGQPGPVQIRVAANE